MGKCSDVSTVIFLLLIFAAPVPTYPVDKIVGTWEYEDETWPGVKFALTLFQNKSYYWKAIIDEDNGEPKLWDYDSGEWTYDGRRLRLVRHTGRRYMEFIVHSASTGNTLKCHCIRGIFGEDRNRRLNLYRSE